MPTFCCFPALTLNKTRTLLSNQQRKLSASAVKLFQAQTALKTSVYMRQTAASVLCCGDSPLIPTLLWCTVADAADSAQMRISVYVCSPQ